MARFPGFHPGLLRIPPEAGGMTWREVDRLVEVLTRDAAEAQWRR